MPLNSAVKKKRATQHCKLEQLIVKVSQLQLETVKHYYSLIIIEITPLRKLIKKMPGIEPKDLEST